MLAGAPPRLRFAPGLGPVLGSHAGTLDCLSVRCGKPCGAEANTAKYLATEAAFEVCDRAMQVHGGFCYAKEYHIERMWREARLLKIAPVSQEMVCNYIAQKILGLPKSY